MSWSSDWYFLENLCGWSMILLFSKTENIRIPANIILLTSGAYLNRYRKQVDKIEPLRRCAHAEWFISNRLSTEKWTNYTRRHKCQIWQGRQHFLPLVDLFSKIKYKGVKTEKKEHKIALILLSEKHLIIIILSDT